MLCDAKFWLEPPKMCGVLHLKDSEQPFKAKTLWELLQVTQLVGIQAFFFKKPSDERVVKEIEKVCFYTEQWLSELPERWSDSCEMWDAHFHLVKNISPGITINDTDSQKWVAIQIPAAVPADSFQLEWNYL